MEFRLTYSGPLVSERIDDQRDSRKLHKHSIRTQFHRQLDNLWKTNPFLSGLRYAEIQMQDRNTGSQFWKSRLSQLTDHYRKDGIGWAPLICNAYGLACRLNVLFLRSDMGKGVIQTGDLDNRIKLLFDALRIPKDKELPESIRSDQEPDPFFCLLEDDALIIDFRVTADRLLAPQSVDPAEVQLVIEVETMMTNPDRSYIEFSM